MGRGSGKDHGTVPETLTQPPLKELSGLPDLLGVPHSHSDGGSQVEVGLWCVVVQRLGKQQRIARPPPARGEDRGSDHRDTTKGGSVFFESNVGGQD